MCKYQTLLYERLAWASVDGRNPRSNLLPVPSAHFQVLEFHAFSKVTTERTLLLTDCPNLVY